MKVRSLVVSTLALAALVLCVHSVSAHCQIPCGIYGDQMRVDQMLEDVQTVEKAMKQISKFGEEENWNQAVRWTTNKETHAQKIQQTVLDYWLAQRIKLPGTDADAVDAYKEKLAVLHRIIVHAMKAKQTTDLKHVEALRGDIKKFSNLYFDEDMKKHMKKEHSKGKKD